MSDLTKEKTDKIAQELGWTPRRTQGYVEGRFCQRNGHYMPECYKIGMDEFSKGFRTGYYKQDDPLSKTNIQK